MLTWIFMHHMAAVKLLGDACCLVFTFCLAWLRYCEPHHAHSGAFKTTRWVSTNYNFTT